MPQRKPAAEVQFQPADDKTNLLVLSRVAPVFHYGYYSYGYSPYGYYPYGWGPYPGVARAYDRVCAGRCTARFAPGVYDLALEKEGHLARSESPVAIQRSSVVRGEYIDRSGIRTGGLLIGIGGLVGGTIMMIVSVSHDNVCTPYYCYYQDHVDGPLLAGGIAVAVGSAIAGAIMASQSDEALFTVLPLRVSSLLPGEHVGLSQALPQGAAIAGKF